MFFVSRTLLTQSTRTIFGGVGIIAALNFVNPQFGQQLSTFLPALFAGEPLQGNPFSVAAEWKVGLNKEPLIVGVIPFVFGIFAIYTVRSLFHKWRHKEDSVVFFFRTLANFIAAICGALPGFIIGKTVAGFTAVQMGASHLDPVLAQRIFRLENIDGLFASSPENPFSFSRLFAQLAEVDFYNGTRWLISRIGEIEFEGYASLIRGDFQSNEVMFTAMIWIAAVILGVLGFYLIRGLLYGVYRFLTFPFRRPAPQNTPETV